MIRALSLIWLLPAVAAAGEPETTTDFVPVAVSWSDIDSTAGCFFFCGPGDIGLDEKLGKRAQLRHSGKYLTLDFGDKVRFRGKLDGKKVRLERQSAHEFDGTWQILQMIEGTFVDGSLVGDYSYQECDTSGRQGCPGRCTITAHVEVHPAERPSKATDETIAGAVRRCVEMGLQRNPAFRRTGTVTVRWRGNPQGALVEIGFWENSFADLWDGFDACVENWMRASQTKWLGTGSFTVKVEAPQ